MRIHVNGELIIDAFILRGILSHLDRAELVGCMTSEGNRAPKIVEPRIRERNWLTPVREYGKRFRLNMGRQAVGYEYPVDVTKGLSEPLNRFRVDIAIGRQYTERNCESHKCPFAELLLGGTISAQAPQIRWHSPCHPFEAG